MMPIIVKIVIGIVVLIFIRDIAAHILGWDADWFSLSEYIATVKHNAAIDRKWKNDGRPVVDTTVGWRPDPFHKQDGYKDNGDGSYSKLIRGGTEEYKKKFQEDIERSK